MVLAPLLSFRLSSQEICWKSHLPQRMLGNDAVSCSAAFSVWGRSCWKRRKWKRRRVRQDEVEDVEEEEGQQRGGIKKEDEVLEEEE